LTTVRQKLEDFDTLDADLALLAEVEELEKQGITNYERMARLKHLRGDYVRATNETVEAKTRLEALKPLVELDLTALTGSTTRLDRLTALVTAHTEATVKIAKLNRLKQPLADAAGVEGLDDALAIATRLERLGTLCANYSGAQSTRAELLEKQTKLGQAERLIDKALTEAYAELTECPSCGQELSADEAKDHLLKEVA
jgi:DNA repair exonuclease SbcCD ATPase subunit